MNSRDIGSRGEDVAVQYLEQQGFQVIGRNVYSVYGEVDIFAYDTRDSELIAVEVKFWDSTIESLEYVITPEKQARMVITLQEFLTHHSVDYRYIRFDVIHIDRSTYKITHLEGAFDGCSLV